MSDKSKDDEIKKLYEEMIEKNKLTPAGLERGIILYQLIGSIINKYRPLIKNPLTGPESTIAMEKEVITALALEMDRNFFEGMLDATMKATVNVLKIPQVAEMTRSFAMEFLGSDKLKNNDDLNDLVTKMMNKKPAQESTQKSNPEDSESLESLLSQFSASARGKKENLN